MSYYPQFGVLLNQYLTKVDRSPAWLARRLGLNNSTVSRWLNDGARPGTPETVARIADVLGINTQREKLLAAAGCVCQGGNQESDPDHLPQTLVWPSLAADSVATATPPLVAIPPLSRNLPQPRAIMAPV